MCFIDRTAVRGARGLTVCRWPGYELYFMAKQSLLLVFDSPADATHFKKLLGDLETPNLSRITAVQLQVNTCPCSRNVH